MQSRSSELFAAEREFDLSRAFQEVAARANAARVTIYPVNGGGLTTNSVADVSQQADRRYTPTPNNDRVRAVNVKAGPGILAEETGGVRDLRTRTDLRSPSRRSQTTCAAATLSASARPTRRMGAATRCAWKSGARASRFGTASRTSTSRQARRR